VDICRPTLLISESTYATTIRDSKRCRERDFLKKVYNTVENGGKVLIPVFALGRAQELCILLDQFWDRMGLKVPIYFSMGLTEKATNYYKLFLTWTNEKIKETFVKRNPFEFSHISSFDRSYADNPNPMVVLATPGMLHAGLSLELFKKWCHDPKNCIIMPGYCVAGTIGHKVLNGLKRIELRSGHTADIRMQVEYMSFSAHADAKGIMQLIRTAQPKNVMLVHGEKGKMQFLSKKIKRELGLKCFTPANGQTVNIRGEVSLQISCEKELYESLEQKYGPLHLTESVGSNITNRRPVVVGKRSDQTEEDECNARKRSKTVNAALVIQQTNDMVLMSTDQACEELKLKRHLISMSTSIPYTNFIDQEFINIVEKALKRYSVVEFDGYLEKIKLPISQKPIKIFKSFTVKKTERESTELDFEWFTSDDNFASEFFKVISTYS